MCWLVIWCNRFGEVGWSIDRSACIAINGLLGVVLGVVSFADFRSQYQFRFGMPMRRRCVGYLII